MIEYCLERPYSISANHMAKLANHEAQRRLLALRMMAGPTPAQPGPNTTDRGAHQPGPLKIIKTTKKPPTKTTKTTPPQRGK